MNNTLKIESADEALEYLDQLINGKISDENLPSEIEIGGELAEIKIEIEGDNYHSSITGNLSRGLWEFQQEIYRAVAFSLYGIASIKSLTKDDQEKFNLVFEVNDGCSDIAANIKDIIGYLKDGVASMDSRHKLILFIAVPLIITSGATFAWVKSIDVDAETKLGLAKEVTTQMDIVRQASKQVPDLNRWVEASEQGARSIAKGASDASKLTIGKTSADSQELADLNRRAPRTTSDTEILERPFRIVVTKDTSSSIRNITLNSERIELNAIIDETQFDEDQLDLLWYAIRHKTPIYLSVAAKTSGDNYKNAVVIDIPYPEIEPTQLAQN